MSSIKVMYTLINIEQSRKWPHVPAWVSMIALLIQRHAIKQCVLSFLFMFCVTEWFLSVLGQSVSAKVLTVSFFLPLREAITQRWNKKLLLFWTQKLLYFCNHLPVACS